ncbi:MAG TPA: WYL domain-containing protein [Ktedonobacteraceae bacterium]|jgi:predicted DNA-binding transcriptional regulator YafY|nr:WYL domain-containing protein [Ktedonobacteraceae bacterium]
MRADRLLSILLLLQVHRRMTAREFAQRLEVSERTIHRDMEALSAAGVPVTAERGTGGGWTLINEYRTNLTGLNDGEIQALFLGGPTRLLHDLGLQQASQAGLIKVLAALPSISRRDAEYVRQRIHVDTAGWHHADEVVPALPTLQEALWQERKVLFTYQKFEETIERQADPLGLVAKGAIWYLVALVEEQVRSYRVSRIQDVHILAGSSVRPPNFDLATFWAQSSSQFVATLPRYSVTIRTSKDFLESIMHGTGRYMRVDQVSASDERDRIEVRLIFQMEEEACGYLLSFGACVEIIEPVPLRAKVLHLAENVLSVYGERANMT